MQSQDWRETLGALSSILGGCDEKPEATGNEAQTPETQSAQTGTLHIALERKGRAGKTATIVFGFTIDDHSLNEIASELKRAIGCGGSARGGEILLQGDRIEAVKSFLTDKGFKVK